MNALTPLSIYVHIPFCVKKCRYCDFLSYPAAQDEQRTYINLLLSEIEKQAPFYDSYKVISVFIGGGTPSVLDGSLIELILCKLKECFHIEKEAEITIEANPDTVTKKKLDLYISSGINRLSIGLQSTDDKQLQILGRIHDFKTFCNAYELAREAGFKNINVDLMSAIPTQTREDYRDSLEKVLEYEPEHISAYSLILEEGTWFYEHQDKLELPTEDEDRELYEMTKQVLASKGYHRYEISNYALDGCECIHNKVYWRRGSYVGFGLGAASMVDEVRWSNKRIIEEYETVLRQYTESGQTFEQSELQCLRARLGENINYLTREEQMEEFMFLGLRMTEGVNPSDFRQKFGLPIEDVYGNVIEKLNKDGLITVDDFVRLTSYGIDVSNYVMAQFLF